MTRKAEDWEAKLGVSGFNPLEVMQLADAVKLRSESVTLGSRTFNLRYEEGKVHYSPERDYAPRGWIDIDKLGEGI
jgi:hypothetical protein